MLREVLFNIFHISDSYIMFICYYMFIIFVRYFFFISFVFIFML